MKETDVKTLFVRYALPTVIGMLVVSFQCIIDGIFVSNGVGPQGLAAVNITMPLTSMFFSIAIMIVSGGVVICGIAQGKGDQRLTEGYTTLTLVTMAVTCAILSVLVLAFLRPISFALGANEMLYPYVTEYLSVFALTVFFYVSPCFTEAFVRLYQKPNLVFVSGLICCLVNVLLDWWFVIGLDMGMRGAAIATVTANFSAAVVLFSQIRLGRMAGNWHDVRRIFFNGSSEMLTFIAAAVTTYVFNLILMEHIGYLGVAALTIVFYFNMIVNFSTVGLSQAMYPLIAYNVGAKAYQHILILLKVALKYSFIIGLLAYVVLYLFKEPIIGLFSDGNEELGQMTAYAATYMTLTYWVSFINIIGSGFHTAIERPIESALIAVCKSLVFVLVSLLALPPLFESLGWGYDLGIWMSIPVGEVCCLAVTVPLLLRSLQKLKVKLAPSGQIE